MGLEHRYIVVKNTDFENYLMEELKHKVREALAYIEIGRKNDDRPPLEAIVIEKDWPEYEPTKKALEDRTALEAWQNKVHKRDQMLEYGRGMEEAADFLSNNGDVSYVKGIGPFCNGWNDFVKKWLA